MATIEINDFDLSSTIYALHAHAVDQMSKGYPATAARSASIGADLAAHLEPGENRSDWLHCMRETYRLARDAQAQQSAA